MKLLRLLLLILLIALLPLEGTAATVGMCATRDAPATTSQGGAPMTHAATCHERMAAADAPTHQAHWFGAHKCGQCAACVMGVALPVRVEWLPASRPAVSSAFRATDVPVYRFVADTLERPPRIA